MCTFYTSQEARPYPSRNFSCKKLKFSSKLTPGIPKDASSGVNDFVN